jgi:hypothetical protein
VRHVGDKVKGQLMRLVVRKGCRPNGQRAVGVEPAVGIFELEGERLLKSMVGRAPGLTVLKWLPKLQNKVGPPRNLREYADLRMADCGNERQAAPKGLTWRSHVLTLMWTVFYLPFLPSQ